MEQRYETLTEEKGKTLAKQDEEVLDKVEESVDVKDEANLKKKDSFEDIGKVEQDKKESSEETDMKEFKYNRKKVLREQKSFTEQVSILLTHFFTENVSKKLNRFNI